MLKNSHSTKGGIKIKKFTIILIFTAIILLFFSYQIFQQDVIRLSDKESQNIESVYLIKESGTYTDILQKISIKGYKDKIIMFLRIDMINNIISDLDIVEENETSNYGGHITEDWFEKRFKDKLGIRWGIALKNNDNIIGTIGYNTFTKDHRANIGYDLQKTYWNQGFTKEALMEVIKFGFEYLGINRIEAEVMPGNIYSEKALKKLRFKKEGILRDWLYWNEKHYDMIMYSLLKRDFFTV